MTDFDTEHGSVDFLDLLSSGSAQDDADSRLESVAFACLVNGLADERAAAILGILDFSDDFLCFAIGGKPLHTMAGTRAAIRRTVHDLGGGPCVTGTTNGLCVALIMPRAAATPDVTCTNTLSAFSTKAPVCLGPLRRGVEGACRTVQAVRSAIAAAPALPQVPRPMRADDVLPERALLGDQDAVDELVKELNRLGREVIFLGDGVPVYREQILQKLKVPCSFAPAANNRQRAASVASLGAVYYAHGRTVTAAEHEPEYLRKSQAEREREEQEKAAKEAQA